jgi:hypothetical protein
MVHLSWHPRRAADLSSSAPPENLHANTFPKVGIVKSANQPRRRPVSKLFEMALTHLDGSDGALHLPSNRCDFHSGTEHCPQFIVIRAGPGAAGWSRTSHLPFAFSP